VQLARSGGVDTLRTIWTQRIAPSLYAICFAPFLHCNDDRDAFYSITCGQPEPSPYCFYRDGAMALDAYSIDYAQSALVYRLSHLEPLYRYRIRATVYHEGSMPLAEEFLFPVDDTTTIPGPEVIAPPGEPAEVWFDVPAGLHRDGVTDLVISRIRGDYAAVSSIELQEYEPEDSANGSGGQSAGQAPLRRPPAISESRPTRSPARQR